MIGGGGLLPLYQMEMEIDESPRKQETSKPKLGHATPQLVMLSCPNHSHCLMLATCYNGFVYLLM